MATPRMTARAPACLSCLRRVTLQQASTSTTTATMPAVMTMVMRGSVATQQQQQRGKATKAELEDLQGIPVRLLEDIVGFGKKDTIMRVKAGRMRNYWFPRGRAEYMTKQRFREMGLTEAAIGVRDRTFGQPRSVLAAMESSSRDANVAAVEAMEADAVAARKKKQALTMPPEQVHDLLKALLPPVLTFERKPIAVPTPTSPAAAAEQAASLRRSPLIASNAVLSEEDEKAAAQATAPTPPPGPIAIFGSVSTQDILARAAEILAAAAAATATDGDLGGGSRVAAATLGDVHGVAIRGLEEGEDRIKRIGVFEVEIVVAKGLEPIVREVDVVPEPLPVA
ncbi:uncharacterized protein B0I36DRAFT_366200 [Microdochium trichocladiopsis]|uniref:Ribosomal protein L9 domain-containing protein n=1 Tax=Microdochium trichocladiopsis TaxID=1682393 RepID=A0A9P9BN73_9PEZI|nr:uncharacterized protein B0I36DRAFT_366200 [Microdochium trichocladiopsis]KAH7026666.1 hypothetical protein B0I36DRAFT_366200 [Microdochium trichocladiopsis]